ncbi:hypothetical protein IPZ60_06785 [Psychrobacter sp. NG25]|uniref:hypothetical protein n=1 Tax=Psychrobacter sp. NG25 TaxID=2782005 RepID=UPI0018838CFF|nr:hypothetical protein [Psychrobacter sp. NG25]MBF0658441.1 hypothetical protein [Psychrobacter sp. NG25]
MSIQKVEVQFQIKYRNSNGDIDFSGANYRIVDKRGTVLRMGKADKDGETAKATVKKGEKLYLELKDISTNTWESPNPYKRMGFTATKSGQTGNVIVSNCYFQAKLMANKWVTFKKPWKYEVIFKGDNNKTITLKGVLNEEGKTKVYDSQKMPMAKEHENTAKVRFNQLALSSQPNVEVVFIEPLTGERFVDSKRVIPVGADKKYREFQIQLASSTTTSTQSKLQLQEKKESRTVILDIDITAGATYTITREDNAKFFDNKLSETRKSDFKDGTSHTVYIPKKYNGKLLLKKGSKLIATFPLENLDPNKKNVPIVFCLSNKSTPVAKQKSSLNSINELEPMMWHFQTKEALAEGSYTFDENSKGSTSDLKKIANTIFGSIAFDGVLLPTVGEAQNALRANNRSFIYDALRKLKVGKDKQDILRFYIKKSKTGANMIVFKGYSGLRGFLTGTRYGIDNMKVGMIASASSVYTAAASVGLGAAAKTTASTAGRSLGGIGFGIVAVFEISEWLTSDDPFNNWSDLWMGLGSSAIKAVIATAVGLAVGGMAIAFTAAAAPAIVIIGIGALAVIGVSFGLEVLDTKFQITNRAKDYINELGY